MRCLACDCALSDREANRKYLNFREIPNPEDRYIGLCDGCLQETDLISPDMDEAIDPIVGDDDEDWIGQGE